MKLIGMLDSPFVRRVAICLDVLGVPFEHESLSVFSTFEQFRHVNPVVKAPTLVCDDGGILMDSSLILQYVESTFLDAPSPLWSQDPQLRLLQMRAVSHAMAGCEKAAQLVYETNLRPAAARYAPWMNRVQSQMTAAFAALEQLTVAGPALADASLNHATLWSAVAWQFLQSQPAAALAEAEHPHLVALSAHCEALPVFRRYPPQGPGVPGLPAN
jgi:glutathione S-transferase